MSTRRFPASMVEQYEAAARQPTPHGHTNRDLSPARACYTEVSELQMLMRMRKLTSSLVSSGLALVPEDRDRLCTTPRDG
jgi:hypothetical protein